MTTTAKKLILVDEFDREYKRLKRPADAVVKTAHSLQLADTLRNEASGDDQKVREYVAALHRYLNLRKGKELPKPLTDLLKVKKEIKINPVHHIPPLQQIQPVEVHRFEADPQTPPQQLEELVTQFAQAAAAYPTPQKSPPPARKLRLKPKPKITTTTEYLREHPTRKHRRPARIVTPVSWSKLY